MEYHSDDRDIPPPRHCYACTRLLTPVFDQDTTYQYDNALWLGFHGGYGMFTDNMDVSWGTGTPRVLKPPPDYEAVICHDCAHDLCDMVPWIASILQPQSSHAHRPGSIPDDHEGWDLPHTPRSQE